MPHIYGDTRADVMFGAGYAGAEDRLFLMDVLRHTGRARAVLVRRRRGRQPGDGPHAVGDRALHRGRPPDADRQRAGDSTAPRARSSSAGRRPTTSPASTHTSPRRSTDPTKLPAEYAALGKTPDDWKATDVIATASLIGGIFGKGGGNEVQLRARCSQAFEKRFGTHAGPRAPGATSARKNDPEAPTTVQERFPYETASPFAKTGLALPDPGSRQLRPPARRRRGAGSGARADAIRRSAAAARCAPRCRPAARVQLGARQRARSRRPATRSRVMGPQVGYYMPADPDGGGPPRPRHRRPRRAFPGVNLYVQLGHGRDYAWSATTATSDNVDTFAEVLCQDDFHYLYKGQCLPMEKLDAHEHRGRPTPATRRRPARRR